jgi:gliding motility-associated-like protein
MTLFTSFKKALLVFSLLAAFQFANATNYQSTGAGGVWNNPTTWSPAGIPTAGDNVIINSGSPVGISSLASCTNITINTGASLIIITGSSLTVSASFVVNGTLDCTVGHIYGACNFSVANSNAATLKMADPNGITTSPTLSGNIQNTGSRTFPSTANYVYEGLTNTSTGNGLPATINGGGSVTIDNTGPSGQNTVTLNSSPSIQNLNLKTGYLSLNGKTVTVNGTISNTGGNLDSSVRANGGTFIVQGATITGPTTFYNLTCNSSNSTITTLGINAPLINGTLLIGNARFGGTNSPRYAKGSTLSYAGTANNRGVEWNADLSTIPTIGVTQGYPDNVFINTGSDFDVCNYPLNGNVGAIPRGLDGDLTTSAFTMLDWIPYSTPGPYYLNPLLNQTGSFTVGHNMIINGGGNIHMSKVGGSGAFTVKGNLTINGATANLNLDSMTNAFTVDSGIIMNNGTLNMGLPGVATKLNVTGDIVVNGGTVNGASGTISLTGAWKRYGTFNAQNGTVNFNGTSSQVITATGGEVFNNMIINNAGDIGMTFSTTINGNLTFIKGLFLTYSSADLIIGASGNIIGASQSTGWVARFSGGNLIRNITTTSPYLFAIGNINTYTPVTLTFNSVTIPGTVAMNTPGFNPVLSMPGIATYALSKTDYANWFWYIKQLTGSFGSYNADLNYGTASLQGSATVSTLKTGVYDGTNWTYPASSGSGTTITATGITPLNGALENIGLANSTCTLPTVYNVTGTGSYCSGGIPAGVDNSETGVNYQLQTAGPVNVGPPVAGTGAAISFGNQTAGTYTVLATNATTLCTSNMNGSAVITISGAPSIATPLTTQNVCYNTAAQNAALSYNTPVNTPTNYSITWAPASSTAGFVDVSSTPLPALGTDIQVPVPAGVSAGTYTGTIFVTNAGGCLSTGNLFTVTINPLPTISGLVSGDICFSSSAQTYNLVYSGATGSPTQYNIIWNTPTSLVDIPVTALSPSPISISIPANATAINNNGTIYVTDANNCTSTGSAFSINIHALPIPTFTTEPGATTCSNIAVTYTTQAGENSYVWNLGAPADYSLISGGSTADNTVTLKWLTAGNKTVSINYIDVNGCTAASVTSSTSTAVTIGPDASNFTITSATSVCTGGGGSTITVNSTTLQNDTYTVSYTLGTPNAATLTASMIFAGGTGTFTVPSGNLPTAGSTSITITTIANSGCSATGLTATNAIVVGTTPTPTFTTEPGVTACTNSIVTYTTQSGESNYVWAFGTPADYSIVSGGSTTDNTTTLKWLTAGNKTVTINYTNGSCTATTPTSSVTTSVSIGPDASNLAITATNVCLGASGSVITVHSTTLQNDTYNVTYSLGSPNATTSIVSMNFTGGAGTFTVPSGSLHATGSTSITITALSNSGCTTSGLSATNSIVVGTIPTPTFTAEPTNTCYHTDVIYTTQTGQSDYVWDFGGSLNTDYSIVSGGSSTDNTVTLQWITTGSKTVKVNYNNTNNCSAVVPASTIATINNCLPLIVPTAFAPAGKNAVWHIKNGENYPYMQIKVFDRWGKIVFECTGNPSWDGTYQGQNLSTGTYIYQINVNDEKYPQVLKGSITLIR